MKYSIKRQIKENEKISLSTIIKSNEAIPQNILKVSLRQSIVYPYYLKKSLSYQKFEKIEAKGAKRYHFEQVLKTFRNKYKL